MSAHLVDIILKELDIKNAFSLVKSRHFEFLFDNSRVLHFVTSYKEEL